MTVSSGTSAIGSVSVVVPTFNRLSRLQRVLEALAAQDVDVPVEIIVISDGSTDGTNEYLTSGATPGSIRPILQDNAGPSVARNRGIEMASGDVVVFIDDDVVVEPDAISAHVAAHRRLGDRVVVIGPMLDPHDAEFSPWVAWEQSKLAEQYNAMRRGLYSATCRQFYTGNASVRREHLVELGGFDPSLRRAEDVELAFRMADLGLEFHFEPAAIGRHYAERSYQSWRSIAREYGHNDAALGMDRPWVHDLIEFNFRQRPLVLRVVIGACVRWRRCESATRRFAELCLAACTRLRLRSASDAALSVIYAIDFFAGVAEEAGSRDAYRRIIGARGAHGSVD